MVGRAGPASGGGITLSVKNLFMSRIQDEMDREDFEMALCYVSPVHSQVTALGFLSYFLLERREKGIFVSVLRPHCYVERLLAKEGVPIEALRSLDAIDRSSAGEAEPRSGRSSLVCEDLSGGFKALLEKEPDLRFMVLDNISGLMPYASPGSIVQFIDDVHEALMVRDKMQVVVMADHGLDLLVLRGIQGLCDRHLDISPNFFG
jgi:hypothetical protein